MLTYGSLRYDAVLILATLRDLLGLRPRPRRQHGRTPDARWPTLVAHYVVALVFWSRNSAVGYGPRSLVAGVVITVLTLVGLT